MLTRSNLVFQSRFSLIDFLGWKELLGRFIRGGGSIWDMEYLTDENGRRVAAFGRSAGFIGKGFENSLNFQGIAVGVITWCHQILHPEQKQLPTLQYHNNFNDLVSYVK